MANASSQPAIALPSSIGFERITLNSKPTASIECSRVQSVGDSALSNTFVVFLNGLIAPQASWLPVMALTLRHLDNGNTSAGNTVSRPQMLAYDRYGQGKTTDRDPGDEGKEEGYGHNTLDVVRDLHQLIRQTTEGSENHPKRIMFVANSIGCAIARLYAQHYPGSVAGMLLLDSVVANSDFVSAFPDPDSPDFDPASLPQDVTPDMLREARATHRKVFYPSVKNPEGLDRRNLPSLLPEADKPLLNNGFGGKPPFITVVGHDPEYFANESLMSFMKTPIAISMNYTNPFWHRYNQGLTKLTTSEKASGPTIAKNCGHFVQKDDPAFVAGLVCKMLENITQEK
ncbi:Alpha/Beta hydrolase protein [Nemania sp. FL0916]|nr:Alpha/Beta hydrolase protein [Nemania sp. FL0916]